MLSTFFSLRDMEVLHKENWTREVTFSLKKFEKQLIIALKVGDDIISDKILTSRRMAGMARRTRALSPGPSLGRSSTPSQ